jgi:hypothetical protein
MPFSNKPHARTSISWLTHTRIEQMAKTPSAPKGITSVPQYIEAIKALGSPSSGFFTYRGVRNAAWSEEAGIFRSNRKNLLDHERDAIRELQSVHPQEFAHDQSMFDRLVRMQHFNLPTRLLDVTANPLVALYFATEIADKRLEPATNGRVTYFRIPYSRRKYFDSDTVSLVANLANLSSEEKELVYVSRGLAAEDFNKLDAVDRLIQFVRTEKPYFRSKINPDELDRAWYVVPKLSNRRIIAQSGAFLIFGFQPRTASASHPDTINIRNILIDKNSKSSIRAELDVLGINQSALFPEIDHAAEYIVARYPDKH